MYTCTLYKNTGFNAVNIPDSKATLALAPSVVAPALDIYQARELSSFVIKANYANIKDCDYLYLQNDSDQTDFAFYSIQNITMTSNDTAILNVTMDYILTAGGAANLTFLDGMCERHHVAVADDIFGAYCEDDAYLAPAETMGVAYDTRFFSYQSDQMTIISSTIDLRQLYEDFLSNNYGEGVDYQSTSGNTVTVPNVPSGEGLTFVIMDIESKTAGSPNQLKTKIPGIYTYAATYPTINTSQFTNWLNQQIYEASPSTKPWINVALSYVRSLGIESCIIAQYSVPSMYFNDTANSWTLDGKGRFQDMEARCVVEPTITFDVGYDTGYGYTVKNKRLLYGEYNKYHLVANATGNEAVFYPEEIYHKTNQWEYPEVISVADIRHNGAPYFNFRYYRGNDRIKTYTTNVATNQKNNTDFFCNAVKGLEWQNVPLVYTGASGSLLNQYKYNATIAARDQQQQAALENFDLSERKGITSGISNIVGGVAAIAGGAVSGQAAGIMGGIGSIVDAGVGMYYNKETYDLQRNHANAEYNIAKNTELQSLLIANNVYAPSYNFPMSEGIRDFIGNGCTVWRPYYTENDVKRVDKILTMYGYKHTTPITATLLSNRAKFNYIKAAGVTIGNTGIPKWLREGVATQFAAGTRIWHVLPDPAIYTNGTNT